MVLFLTSMVLCRDNAQLSAYADVRTARAIMAQELKKLVEANPCFREKLQFPNLKHSRLRMLINQRSILFSLKFLNLILIKWPRIRKRFLYIRKVVHFFFVIFYYNALLYVASELIL